MSDQNRLLLAAALMAVVLFVSWQFMGSGGGSSEEAVPAELQQQTTAQEATGTVTESGEQASTEQDEQTSSATEPADSLPGPDTEQPDFVQRTITVVVRDDDDRMVTAGISTATASVEDWYLEGYDAVPGEDDGSDIDLGNSTWMDLGFGFTTQTPDTVVVDSEPVSIELVEVGGDRSVRYTFYPGFYGFEIEMTGYDQITRLNSNILPISEINVTPGNYFKAQWNSEKVRSRDTDDIGMDDQVGNVEWIAARSKYFGVILLPRSYERAYGYVYASGGETSPSIGIQDRKVLVYAGPLDYGRLRELGRDTHLMVDFGWPVIRDIGRLLFWFCTSVLSFVGNWGLKIIILSVALKVVLMPLTTKSFRSMAKLKQVQPRMKELQEKYRNDPKALQTAMQKLYREEGVNPLGGCLPLLMQMPVFFALYRVLANSVQLRGAEFLLWIKDLSTPEILIPFGSPMLGLDGIGLLAVLMGVSMFLQQKMTTVDQSQKGMTYILPIFMTYLFMRFPAGLTLYWFMNNLLTIGQQQMINKQLEAEKQA